MSKSIYLGQGRWIDADQLPTTNRQPPPRKPANKYPPDLAERLASLADHLAANDSQMVCNNHEANEPVGQIHRPGGYAAPVFNCPTVDGELLLMPTIDWAEAVAEQSVPAVRAQVLVENREAWDEVKEAREKLRQLNEVSDDNPSPNVMGIITNERRIELDKQREWISNNGHRFKFGFRRP